MTARFTAAMLCFAVVATAGPESAVSAPTLRVRGRAAFQKVRALHYVKEGTRHTVLTAVLRDLDTRMILSNVKVRVTVYCNGRLLLRRRAVTSQNGRLAMAVPQCPGGMRAQFNVEDDADYVLDASSEFSIDTAKQDVLLEVTAPKEVSAERPEFTVGVTARQEMRLDVEREFGRGADPGGAASRIPVPGIRVSLTASGSNRKWLATTGQDGRAFFTVRPGSLGKVGRIRLTVRSDGTTLLNSAVEQLELMLYTRPTISLTSRKQTGRVDESVKLEGVVSDRHGVVSGGLVHIRCQGKTRAVVHTDDRGGYLATVRLKDLPVGPAEFVAHFVPTKPWRKAAESRKLKFTVRSARPVPLTLYVASGILTVLVTLLLLALRNQPWERWAKVLKERQEAKARPAGIRLSSSELRAYLGTGRFSLSGQVQEFPTGRPIGGARLTVEGEDEGDKTLSVVTDSSGKFGPYELPAGSFLLRCSGAGYLEASRQVSVPHRGELDGVTVELVSIRRKVMEQYFKTVLPFLPRRRFLQVWTPQEVLDHVRSRWQKNAPGVAALTAMVERTFYSGFVPGPAVLTEAERLCRAAASEWMNLQVQQETGV